MAEGAAPAIDLERLFKLRVVVARFGEMDVAQWWNSKQLGPAGALALRRGLPRTHRFAQARSVFAIAARRCGELFAHPQSVTLWNLPAGLEESLDAKLESWLDEAPAWEPFFASLEQLRSDDLRHELHDRGLVSAVDLETLPSPGAAILGSAVEIPQAYSERNEDIAHLALGFSWGRPRSPVVPYKELAS